MKKSRLVGMLCLTMALEAFAAVGVTVDAVADDHARWSYVTGRSLTLDWDWRWAGDNATQVKVSAKGARISAEATFAKPTTSIELALPNGEDAFDVSLVFLDAAGGVVSPTRTTRLYAVEKFQDDVRQPRNGVWRYKKDALVPFDAAWANATNGVTLAAQATEGGATTNLASTAAWGGIPLLRRDFSGTGWHLTLTFANDAVYEADVQFVSDSLTVIIR